MDTQELLKKIALLESINDQLESELIYIDTLMRKVGFSNGLKTIKFAVEDLIEINSTE